MENIEIYCSPGELIKNELSERGISQKALAEYLSTTPSHMSEIISGRRSVTIEMARRLETFLGISADAILSIQNTYKLHYHKNEKISDTDIQDRKNIEAFDQIVSVKSLIKDLRPNVASPTEKLSLLCKHYGLTQPETLEQEMANLRNRCFRKSAKNGMDTRMIATWVVKAQAQARKHLPSSPFDRSRLRELSMILFDIFHKNRDTMRLVTEAMNKHGIGFSVVPREKYASVDGYSFMVMRTPYIVVTARYNRIDNFAFTIMHELGHIALGHTNESDAQINIEDRGLDSLSESLQEAEADRYASEALIPQKIWNFAPTVPLNSFLIQKRYSEWASVNHLNKWIVLGRVSHETGMYKFTSDESRKID